MEENGGDEAVLKLMDSMDNYMILLDSLSSSLSQGWLQLASARHSMGVLRVNGALLDHQPHPASTTLQVVDVKEDQPGFVLRKWGVSSDNENGVLEEKKSKEDSLYQNSGTLKLRTHGSSQDSRDMVDRVTASANGDKLKVDDQSQRERLKSLSVFGTLVSPKLRTAQMSFETALETLVEIANTRSIILSSFDQVHAELETSKRLN